MYGEDPSNAMPVINVLYFFYSSYTVQIDTFGVSLGWQAIINLFAVLFFEDLVYARHSQKYKDE